MLPVENDFAVEMPHPFFVLNGLVNIINLICQMLKHPAPLTCH